MRNFDGTTSLTASIWLVVLLFPAVFLVVSDISVVRTVAGLIALTVFSALYAVGFGLIDSVPRGWARRRWFLLWFGALCAVSLLAAPVIGANASFLVPFLVAMLAFNVPVWISAPATVMIVLGSSLLVYLLVPDALPGVLAGTVLSPLMVYVVAMVTLRFEHRDRLAHQLEIARERESIAVDVHDLLGHSLTVVTLKSELARRLVDTDPAAAKEEMEQITRLSRTALAEVRSTVTRMRHLTWAARSRRRAGR